MNLPLAIHIIKDNKTAVLRSSKKSYIFDIFDENFKKIHNQIIKSPRKERYIGYITHNDVINSITVFSPKRKERIIYCHTLNIAKKTHRKIKLFEATVEKKTKAYFPVVTEEKPM